MGTEENVAASAGDRRDDLEKIAGIGRYWSKALNKVGIYRFRDLAQYSPADLSQLLEEAGLRASPEKTARWIAEAKERAWETYAEFSVFFEYKIDEHGEREWQTRVYGEGEKRYGAQRPFQGIEPAPWANWILRQAELPVAAEPVPAQIEAAPLPAPKAPYDAQIEILGVQVSEIEPSPSVSEERLKAEVGFRVSGPEAAKLIADRLSFQIEIYTVDLESGVYNLVAFQGGKLEPEVFEYTSRLAFPLPELGCYKVYAIVHLLPPGERIAHHRGPKLTVLP